jgi:hypothetical protein
VIDASLLSWFGRYSRSGFQGQLGLLRDQFYCSVASVLLVRPFLGSGRGPKRSDQSEPRRKVGMLELHTRRTGTTSSSRCRPHPCPTYLACYEILCDRDCVERGIDCVGRGANHVAIRMKISSGMMTLFVPVWSHSRA